MLKRIYYRFIRTKFRRKKSIFINQRYDKFIYGYKKQSNSRFMNNKTGALTIIISIVALLGLIMLFPHFIRTTYRVTVTNKQIVKRDNTDKYLIYTLTEDGEIKIFENTNNLLELKFNSEDLYGAISINRKYEVVAYGFSIPLLLRYQNIVKIRWVDI